MWMEVHPGLHRQLQNLQTRMGVSIFPVESSAGQTTPGCYSIEIPWCNKKLNWKILFDAANEQCGPDFVFDEDTFVPLSPLIEQDEDQAALKKAILEWSPGNDAALTNVLRNVLQAFRSHQKKRLKAVPDSRIHFELDTMPAEGHFELLLSEDFSGKKACFGMTIEVVDVSPIIDILYPACYENPPPQIEAFKLFVAFPVGSTVPPEISVKAPPALSQLLPSSALTPSWSEGVCLMEYKPLVIEKIQQHIKSTVERLTGRIALIDKLGDLLGLPLERKYGLKPSACFLLAHGMHQFLMFIDVGLGFPDEKPAIMVQMIRRPTRDGPFRLLHLNRWSQRWTPLEMAKRVVAFLKEEMPKLKQSGDI